jgi:hypothetical protein
VHLKRQGRDNAGAAITKRLDHEDAVEVFGAFTHRSESDALVAQARETDSVVHDFDRELSVAAKANLTARGPGMPRHVRHGFRDDDVRSDLDRRWKAVGYPAVRVDRKRPAAAACAVQPVCVLAKGLHQPDFLDDGGDEPVDETAGLTDQLASFGRDGLGEV